MVKRSLSTSRSCRKFCLMADFLFFVNADLKAFAEDLCERVCQKKKEKNEKTKRRNPSKQVRH